MCVCAMHTQKNYFQGYFLGICTNTEVKSLLKHWGLRGKKSKITIQDLEMQMKKWNWLRTATSKMNYDFLFFPPSLAERTSKFNKREWGSRNRKDLDHTARNFLSGKWSEEVKASLSLLCVFFPCTRLSLVWRQKWAGRIWEVLLSQEFTNCRKGRKEEGEEGFVTFHSFKEKFDREVDILQWLMPYLTSWQWEALGCLGSPPSGETPDWLPNWPG